VATSLRVDLTGDEALRQVLERIKPSQNRGAFASALTEMALLTARIAAEEKIIRGGRFRGPAGPRGGRAALTNRAAHPTRLTSRSGRLRASLAGRGYRAGIDDSALPREIAVGTEVNYAPVHEFGGTFTQTIPRHVRTRAFGQETKPYVVREHSRTATYRPRPFLGPGLADAAPRFPAILVKHLERVRDGASQ
jgi:phage gpG-like protein